MEDHTFTSIEVKETLPQVHNDSIRWLLHYPKRNFLVTLCDDGAARVFNLENMNLERKYVEMNGTSTHSIKWGNDEAGLFIFFPYGRNVWLCSVDTDSKVLVCELEEDADVVKQISSDQLICLGSALGIVIVSVSQKKVVRKLSAKFSTSFRTNVIFSNNFPDSFFINSGSAFASDDSVCLFDFKNDKTTGKLAGFEKPRIRTMSLFKNSREDEILVFGGLNHQYIYFYNTSEFERKNIISEYFLKIKINLEKTSSSIARICGSLVSQKEHFNSLLFVTDLDFGEMYIYDLNKCVPQEKDDIIDDINIKPIFTTTIHIDGILAIKLIRYSLSSNEIELATSSYDKQVKIVKIKGILKGDDLEKQDFKERIEFLKTELYLMDDVLYTSQSVIKLKISNFEVLIGKFLFV